MIAMQNRVTDFVSADEPSQKKQVVYQLLLRVKGAVLYDSLIEQARIKDALLWFDSGLHTEDISIGLSGSGLFVVEVSTQIGDIQCMTKAINSLGYYFEFVDVDFADIHLNEGVCLVKRDATNPIHALVNIADTAAEKYFLERDAGATSGTHTATFQDRSWMFNRYCSLDELYKVRGRAADFFAVKLCLQSKPPQPEGARAMSL